MPSSGSNQDSDKRQQSVIVNALDNLAIGADPSIISHSPSRIHIQVMVRLAASSNTLDQSATKAGPTSLSYHQLSFDQLS